MKKSVLFLIFFGIVLININLASAWADNGSSVQYITGCNKLNTTNAVYYLSQSINTNETCMNITANNITLDCVSWTNRIIYGNISSATIYYGIYSNKLNTTIKNCEVTRGTLSTADHLRVSIYFVNLNNSNINSVNATNNYIGIYLDSSSNNNFLTSNTVNSNVYGIYLDSSSGNNITSNTLTSNSNGIKIQTSSNNTLANNTVTSASQGILLTYATNNILINNTANSNINAGIYLTESTNNNITNNTANFNGWGFYLFGSTLSNLFVNNTANSNGYSAVSFSDSSVIGNNFSTNSFSRNHNNIITAHNNLNEFTSNQFLDNLNTSSNFSTNSQEGTSGNRIDFNLTMKYLNGTNCPACSYELSLYPSESSLMNSSSGALMQGNFTPAKVGIYSLRINITDENNNSEVRKYIFLINVTKNDSVNYYFRSVHPTHGQPMQYGGIVDAGSLIYEAPTSSESRTCSDIIGFSVNNLSSYLFGAYKQINYSIWYQVSTNGHTSIKKYGSSISNGDYNTSVNATAKKFGTFNFSVDWGVSDYFWNWYTLSIALYASSGNPYIYSNATNPSFVNITYSYPSTPAIREITNEDADVLSATMDSNTSKTAQIILDGDGTTNISIEMPNSTADYEIVYDNILCSDNPDCTLNANSNGIINLTLTLGSEHTLDIDGDTPLVTIISPTAITYTSSGISFEVRTSENSTCNYSVNSGETNYSMTANSTGTGFTASKTLSNGDYIANYYCSDIYGNLNNSENVSFSVSVSSLEDSPRRGGSSTSFWTRTYLVNESQFNEGYSKELLAKQRLEINISGENHYVGVTSLTSTNATINVSSTSQQKIMNVGEEWKVELTGDNYYDLIIQLNSINNSKANLFVVSSNQNISNESFEDTKIIKEKERGKISIFVVISTALLIIITLFVCYIIYRKRKANKRIKGKIG